MAEDFTEAAYEIAELASYLRAIKNQDTVVTSSVIQSQIVDPGNRGASLFRVYNTVLKRTDALSKFVTDVQDSFLDAETKRFATVAVGQVAVLFSTQWFNSPYGSARQTCLQDQNIVALKFFARTARAHRPLRKIDSGKITEIKRLLAEASEDLNQQGLPTWAKAPLADGIADLLFTLDNFKFLGHDEAVSQLLTLRASAEAIFYESDKKGFKPSFVKSLTQKLTIARVAGCRTGWQPA